MAGLCQTCARRFYTCDIGSCKECGSYTSSGGFELCDPCAAKLDECASCGLSIANPPKDDPDEPRPHVVSLDIPDRLSVQTGSTRAEVIADGKAKVAAAAKELRKWLDEHNLKSVVIENDTGFMSILTITCSLNQAKEVAKAPGVSHVYRGD